MDWWFDNVSSITVGLFLAGCLVSAIAAKHKSKRAPIEKLVMRGFAASGFPTGVSLIFCAFNPSLITKISGIIGLYIAVAAVVFLYVSWKTVFEPFD